MEEKKTAFAQRCETLANNEKACHEAYNNQYHKVRAEVGFDDWRSVWRFLYRNRLEGLHWHVLEQDRLILEDMAPDARSREFLYEHDQGMARVRRVLEKRARDQIRAEAAKSSPAAAAAE